VNDDRARCCQAPSAAYGGRPAHNAHFEAQIQGGRRDGRPPGGPAPPGLGTDDIPRGTRDKRPKETGGLSRAHGWASFRTSVEKAATGNVGREAGNFRSVFVAAEDSRGARDKRADLRLVENFE